jgi:methylated-DNA-[protein]-cysteine S-methyltransferase
MHKIEKYIVFRTAWGFFGLRGTDDRLRHTSLPVVDRAAVVDLITASQTGLQQDDTLFADLQERVKAYFDGSCVDFSDVPPDVPHASRFAKRVLLECGKIRYGQTISYARLAELAGSPGAARAAGSVMAANPMPLIIPCHRIVRSDGQTGNFTANGGPQLKKRLLALETQGACMTVINHH